MSVLDTSRWFSESAATDFTDCVHVERERGSVPRCDVVQSHRAPVTHGLSVTMQQTPWHITSSLCCAISCIKARFIFLSNAASSQPQESGQASEAPEPSAAGAGPETEPQVSHESIVFQNNGSKAEVAVSVLLGFSLLYLVRFPSLAPGLIPKHANLAHVKPDIDPR